MESPRTEATFQVEASMFDFDGPPSSPFMTEVETQSRSASKQWEPESTDAITEEAPVPTTIATPEKAAIPSMFDLVEDKENVPQDEPTATLKKMFTSPERPSTPQRMPTKPSTPEPEPVAAVAMEAERRNSTDADLMPPPPPSTRKAHTTPRKTPLKPSRSAANTPRPLSRGDSYESAVSARGQTPSAFQAGLDMRTSALPQVDAPNVDDTCFSAFSEIPDMTLFAKLSQSPTKRGDMLRSNTDATPRTTRKRSSPSRSPSPTPRRQKTPATQNHDGTTSFLIDFTQQFEGVNNYRPSSPGKSATESNLLQYINTQRSPHKPSRHTYATPSKPNSILNLLDFDLPPAPTPRSVPTITVRELESLKSSYLSQISSLEATLSGRKAEVESLKKAVGDAERRVGEAQEAVREERGRREHVEQEKAGWERRGREVETVLQSVKEEVMKSEAEKEDLLRRMEDSERRVENAEDRAVKAEERFADALAARAGTLGDGDGNGNGNVNAVEEQVQRLVAAQIDAKIEAVSRELHAVYREKHERKVGTLKKSYEARGERKCADLQQRVAHLERQNDELLAARDATFSNHNDSASYGTAVADHDAVELKAALEEQKAAFARLDIELQTSQHQQAQLMRELQQERIEKGDLVAAVDEMLALQQSTGNNNSGNGGAAAQGAQQAMSVVEDFRKSISSRRSGLRAPGGGGGLGGGLGGGQQSRIGGPAGSLLARSTSGGAGAGASASSGGKSRILANIERMGRAGGGGSSNAGGTE
ncbi:hypothetical protein LTR36_000848 [Oleoguttula mirabilis]|uniref:Uncharacterized protein n=1 Tax=Oleoguttula mirabilis TaxID=1507867 RepID=A0AAV9J3V2_9PEZI|nr:hypothetical protein LTR36_000848 [Oleoguttula mirabilis]